MRGISTVVSVDADLFDDHRYWRVTDVVLAGGGIVVVAGGGCGDRCHAEDDDGGATMDGIFVTR